MSSSPTLPRIVVVLGLCTLAAARVLLKPALSEHMDATFFTLIGAALVLILVPLERMTSFKAGGVEVALQKVEVRGAISGLNLDRIRDTAFRTRLSALEEELRIARGARVLWVDDRPHKLIAERRLMRALGIEVVPAISTETARGILDADNDFDLMITDVQRQGEMHKVTGGVEIHDGVNYVVWLRNSYEDPVARSIAVVFYAAYEWERLVKFTRPARELQPEPDICNTVEDLISKVLKRLAEVRACPLALVGAKEPTSPRRGA